MSMQERPDNEAPQDGLDRLFRKSAEEFDPLYDPAAWQTMSAKLDERDRVIAWGYALRWGLGIMAFILLLSVGWYGYKQSKAGTVAVSGTSRHMQPERSLPIDSQFPNPKNGEPKAVASPSQQDLAGQRIDNQPMNNENETSQCRRLNWSVVRQPLSPKQENVAGNTDQPTIDPSESRSQSGSGRKSRQEPEQTASKQSTTKKGSTKPGMSRFVAAGQVTPDRVTPDRVTPDRVMPDRVTPAGLASDQLAGTAGTTKRAGYEHRNPDIGPPDTDLLSSTKEAINVLRTDSVLLNGHNEIYRIGPVDAMGNRGSLQWPEWPMLVIPALSLPASIPSDTKVVKPSRDRGLSVRVVVAPDLSAIGLKNFTRPGTNYGLLIEYRFNKRFSVQAGVVQSKKIYTATPDQYAWPANWKWTVKPIGVEAICDMLDIPINLRYDLAVRPMGKERLPARWFVSSGVTTYIMQKEQYDYVYENPQNPWIKVKSWATNTGRYNFSHLNLSMGYERPIGRRFAWQVEPFVKTPLKGVGFFKTNLLSTGAFLSLKYRL